LILFNLSSIVLNGGYMHLNCYKPAKYNMEDCVKVVHDFYATNKRVPTKADIDLLSKQRKSPDFGIFVRKGGLNWVIEKAGLKPINLKSFSFLSGDVERSFKKFVIKFRSENEDRFPTPTECLMAAKRREIPGYSAFKSNSGKTYGEFLISLGASNRKSKLANQPALEMDIIAIEDVQSDAKKY